MHVFTEWVAANMNYLDFLVIVVVALLSHTENNYPIVPLKTWTTSLILKGDLFIALKDCKRPAALFLII